MFNSIFKDLSLRFKTGETRFQRENLAFINIDKLHLLPALQWLKVTHGYRHLVLLTAVDYIEQGQFQLTYILHNPETKSDVGLRVLIDRENASMESAHLIWPTISTYQRELKEMFGIDFPGSPRVDEPFILEGWEGLPPYRRDFDTKEFANSFYHQRGGRGTNDPAEYMKEKLYPNE
ncbi:NAD(P)H-quinone oxidoreductase subunit J, chloroplastic [bioreactor metagenome]|uniref:NAD(P)H-quinone oxidoreductase subunit J, chloroplastic n=1 Tax=bioreactor metagenome TaxID=1076179 RepID=A0A645ADH3_9ZZZZ